jgi:hypothetical protein
MRACRNVRARFERRASDGLDSRELSTTLPSSAPAQAKIPASSAGFQRAKLPEDRSTTLNGMAEKRLIRNIFNVDFA